MATAEAALAAVEVSVQACRPVAAQTQICQKTGALACFGMKDMALFIAQHVQHLVGKC